jgi:hypothetical protein
LLGDRPPVVPAKDIGQNHFVDNGAGGEISSVITPLNESWGEVRSDLLAGSIFYSPGVTLKDGVVSMDSTRTRK